MVGIEEVVDGGCACVVGIEEFVDGGYAWVGGLGEGSDLAWGLSRLWVASWAEGGHVACSGSNCEGV